MQKSSIVKHILALTSGIIVMLWTLYLMVSPARFALGIVLFLITLVLSELLLSGEDVQIQESHSAEKRRKLPWEELIVAAYLVSLGIMYFVSSEGNELWLTWNDLATMHPLNMLRMVAAFGFNFFPGYVILMIAGRHGQFQGKLLKLVTSYLLSLFVISTVGLISAALEGVIDVFFLNAFLLANAIIIVVYLLHRFLDRRRPQVGSGFGLNRIEVHKSRLSAVLLLLTVVFLVVWLLWPYSQIGFFIGGPGSDMWRHHGDAQSFLDGRAFAWLQVPWWFELYIASFTVISGVPLANAYFSLYPLMAVVIISFYVMVQGFIKDRKVAAVATLFYTAFSGFAWVYAVYLRDFLQVSRSWIGILYDTGDKFLYQGWYPPFLVGFKHSVVSLTGLWWMIYAVRRLNLRSKLNFSLMSCIWALSYLFHVVDGLVFFAFLVVLLLSYTFSHDVEGRKNVRMAALAVLVALAFVTVTELALTDYYFTYTSFFAPTRRYYYLYSPSFYFAAVGAVSAIVLSYGRMPKSIHSIFVSKYNALKSKTPRWVNSHLGVEAIFYIYGLSLIVWILLLEGFHSAQLTLGQVPLYAYPAMLGVPLILGLVGISFLLLGWKKLEKEVRNALLFGVFSSVILTIMGLGVTAMNLLYFYTGGGERAIVTYYTRATVAILAAYAFLAVFKRGARKIPRGWKLARFAAPVLLTSLLVIAGVSSTLIAQDFSSSVFFSQKLSDEELQALNYLYLLPKGYAAYLEKSSGTSYIRAFANDKWWDDPGLWLGGAEWESGGVHSPENVILTLKRTDAAYIYVNRDRDGQTLHKSLLLQLLLTAVPVTFNNSEVIIYSVPPSIQAPTSSPSELGIIKPEQSDGPAYEAYVLSLFSVAFSGVSYQILDSTSDPRIDTVSTAIILPYDPAPHAEDTSALLNWVSSGKDLVVFNTDSFGTFEEQFGLRPKELLVSCDSSYGWSQWAGRGTTSVETAEKVEGNSSLRLSFENPLSYQWSGWIYNVTQAEGKPWNLTGWDNIGIWVHTNSSSGPQFYLKLYDVNGVSGQFGNPQLLSRWNGTQYVSSFNGWKRFLIPIKECFGSLDLTNITRLEISTGFQLPVDVLVDEIALYRNASGSANIANSIIGSHIVDLPLITVPPLDLNGATGVIANYTLDGLPVAPFAIENNVASGNVSFVNILPLNSFIVTNLTKVNVYEILVQIYQMLRILP